ncbi:MAG: LamG domain-containing protein [Eubacteriales bacterium]|nr:LamG domain-containing protein [Eubacteriales bacterium]
MRRVKKMVWKTALAIGMLMAPCAAFAEEGVQIIGEAQDGISDESLMMAFSFEENYENAADDTQGINFGRRTFGEGVKGSAVYLNGNGDYIIVGKECNLPGDFTFNVWLNTDEENKERSDAGILAKYETDYYGPYDFYLNYNHPSFWVSDGNGGHEEYQTITELEAGQWYMLTYTYQAEYSKLSIYINGEYDTSFQSIPITENEDTVTIGRQYLEGDREKVQYQGWLDELALYGRAFSEEEVKELYDSYGK